MLAKYVPFLCFTDDGSCGDWDGEMPGLKIPVKKHAAAQ